MLESDFVMLSFKHVFNHSNLNWYLILHFKCNFHIIKIDFGLLKTCFIVIFKTTKMILCILDLLPNMSIVHVVTLIVKI